VGRGSCTATLSLASRARGTTSRVYSPDALPLAAAIRDILKDSEFISAHPSLLKTEYRGHPNPFAGHCYTASEVFFHADGAWDSDFRPCRLKLKSAYGSIPAGTSHWWLEDSAGGVLDLTAEQFSSPFPYRLGQKGGFLTRQPCQRSQILLARLYDPSHHAILADALVDHLRAK
jgi:hypothetical protein